MIKKSLLCLSVLALSLGALPALAVADAPFRIASGLSAGERAFDQANQMISRLEMQLRTIDSDDADFDDNDLVLRIQADNGRELETVRRYVLVEQRPVLQTQPGYQQLVDRVVVLRRDYARMGLPVSSWSSWNYDNRSLTPEEIALIDRVETRFAQLNSAPLRVSSSVYNPDLEPVLIEIRTTLDSPEFRDNPDLVYYRSMYADDMLRGYSSLNQGKRVIFLDNEANRIYTSINSLDVNDTAAVARLREDANRTLTLINSIEQDGYLLPDYTVSIRNDGTVVRTMNLVDTRTMLTEISNDPVIYYNTRIRTVE